MGAAGGLHAQASPRAWQPGCQASWLASLGTLHCPEREMALWRARPRSGCRAGRGQVSRTLRGPLHYVQRMDPTQPQGPPRLPATRLQTPPEPPVSSGLSLRRWQCPVRGLPPGPPDVAAPGGDWPGYAPAPGSGSAQSAQRSQGRHPPQQQGMARTRWTRESTRCAGGGCGGPGWPRTTPRPFPYSLQSGTPSGRQAQHPTAWML